VVKFKPLTISHLLFSHRNYVSDIHFVPKNAKVDKRTPVEGKYTHFISCSEDGLVLIWDTRSLEKDLAKNQNEMFWRPSVQVQLFRQDGSGELGLSRMLFELEQTTPTFLGASDEGDLVQIDWSARPPMTAGMTEEQAQKSAEYVRLSYESERNHRPVLALERSPFYPDLIMTVHDFNFCIWNLEVKNYEEPIFRSANTAGGHNTCGAFSPSRPGVIFITKTYGIDVWDFLDQSNKPSLTLNFSANVITYLKFKPTFVDKKQYLAYGDNAGNFELYEVPPNLRVP